MNSKERRYEMHEILRGILGTNDIYYQPPESVKLHYPCIVYSLSGIEIRNADNNPYKTDRAYQVTLITKDPDTLFVDEIIKSFSKVRYLRHFVTDNLHHDVFIIYY